MFINGYFLNFSQWLEDLSESSVTIISSGTSWWVLYFLTGAISLCLLLHTVASVTCSCFQVSDFLFSFYMCPVLPHVEPFYGTICLYNRERREKLSEDFYFRHTPTETQNVRTSFIFAHHFNGHPLFFKYIFGTHYDWQNLLLPMSTFLVKISFEPRGIFYLDAPSSVCLLIQLEKHATEEGGVTSAVYSRKEPVRHISNLAVTFSK